MNQNQRKEDLREYIAEPITEVRTCTDEIRKHLSFKDAMTVLAAESAELSAMASRCNEILSGKGPRSLDPMIAWEDVRMSMARLIVCLLVVPEFSLDIRFGILNVPSFIMEDMAVFARHWKNRLEDQGQGMAEQEEGMDKE